MKHALIVDDSRLTRKLVRRILTRLHFQVSEAEDGSAALVYCREHTPDLILLDWNMPEMDGLEFLIRLRQLPNGGTPKVVFCTTENQKERIESALSAGADEYVMKPFDDEIIKVKLEQVGIL
jgi:two-component system, chemotaxis family, chemotaxis protein CheY